jgi:vancomycin resistance protein YoaR
VIVLCALVAALVALDYWSNAGAVYRGVEVGGVPLGGKTPQEARRALEERASRAPGEVRLTGPGGGFILDKEEMGFRPDVAASVEEAYGVGRRGNITERLGERLRAAFGTVGIPPEVEYAPEVVRTAAEEAAKRANEQPRDASVAVAGGEVRVEEAREGFRTDVPRTVENVEEALENLGGEAAVVGEELGPRITTRAAERAAEEARAAVSGPVVLAAEGREWTLTPAEVGGALTFASGGGEIRAGLDEERLRAALGDVFSALTVEPVEAGFDVGGSAAGGAVTVTPGREGRRIEEEKLLGAMRSGLFEGRREYRVPVATVEPGLTTAEAGRMKPTELLGSYRTDYRLSSDKSDERMENLSMSSGAVDGTVLAPGEVFSMNDKVSGFDYNASKVIVNGRETLADGGGLCQVTSTLYNAVNEAGLDVTERSPHYAQLPYIRPGLDATVWFGGPNGEGELDMKFENTTDAYVLVRQYVAESGYVYAEVWGQPDGTEVRTWSEPVYRNADSAEWVTYQTYKKDGEVLYDGVLHRDTYQALKDEEGKPIPADTVPIAPVNP